MIVRAHALLAGLPGLRQHNVKSVLQASAMLSNPPDFAPVRFSTRALPERDRLPMWREEFGRRLVRVDIEPLTDSSFCADATLRALPGLRTVTCAGSVAARYERTAAQAADGDPFITLFVNLGGKAVVSCRSREEELGRGDAVLVRHGRGSITASGGYLGVVIPRDALASRVDDVASAIMRPIPRCSAPLRLLTDYLHQLDGCSLTTPQLRQTVETHVHDLVALTVGGNRAGREVAMSAVAAARLGAARAHIAESFDEPELTVGAVAGRLGVSPRYLQILFETAGTTFTAYVNELRLQRALALLTEAPSKRRIVDIALEAGFSDLSHFNRLFRSRFGDTPSGVRTGTAPGGAREDTQRR
jgi:AraC-like DNA-binding protein